METARPFAEACERNRGPILAVLKRVFADRRAVLEIGSGTGQHAAYFAPELPHLRWLASDVAENLPGIRMWGLEPIELDVDQEWPRVTVDAVFSANTAHILSWRQVERMFAAVARLLPAGGLLALYGPFHYGGQATSQSNAQFDAWLRARNPASGVRNFEDLQSLANRHGMHLVEDHPMPANNRLIVWRCSGRAPEASSVRNSQ